MIALLGKFFPSRGDQATVPRCFLLGTILARNRKAHTLVEIAVALAIVSVAAGLAWGVMGERVGTSRMLGVARMMAADLNTVRTVAIDHNREARLLFVESDAGLDPADVQHGAWRLQVGNKLAGSDEWDTLPVDENGVIDETEGVRSLEVGGENETRGISLADWGDLDGDAIVFSPRGWVSNPASDFVGGYITLQVVNKLTEGGTSSQRANIRLSRTGMVRVEVSEATSLPATAVGAAEASAQ